MTSCNIRLAERDEMQLWDSYVEAHAHGTPYHLSGWRRAVEEAYGFECPYLLAMEAGRITGILPLVIMGLPWCGKGLVSLPYCDVGGVLADSLETGRMLFMSGVQLATDRRIETLELRNGAVMEGQRGEQQYRYQSVSGKVRMVLELPESSERLWKGFKSKLRSQIRKAEKNGLTFRLTGDINGFYTVFSENMRDLGSPVHSRMWIRSVIDAYGEKAKVGLVLKGENLVGGGIILRCGSRISIPWASTLRAWNRLGPNMLLYWKLLEYAADHGVNRFDFGRSTPGEGTYRFKKQWGARPQPLEWIRIFPAAAPIPPGQSSSASRETAARLWRQLPLPLANYIGPRLRKYISL